MSGIYANVINLITDNLRDRYENGFPILKELLQNAEDAKSTIFEFGYHEGFPEAKHPLLNGSGLYFFNDGEFKKSDKRAIASFAENTKAGVPGTIGKFGLGMKSVFHLCEAFFYVSSDGVSYYKEFINPWFNKNKTDEDKQINSEWNYIDVDKDNQDWNRLLELKNTMESETEHGNFFFLWLPLRKKNQTPPIIQKYPGDDCSDIDFLFEETFKKDLTSILPLLEHLTTIKFNSAKHNFKISIDRNLGEIIEDEKIIAKFYRDPKKIESLSLSNKHEKWPRSRGRDEYGLEQEYLDKNEAEGSVVLYSENLDKKNESSTLAIQWALFLPLEVESHKYTAKMDNTTASCKIFLHGQFFVDSGRKGIYKFENLSKKIETQITNEDHLREEWNKQIAQEITLPLFLKRLAFFVEAQKFSNKGIFSITEAIKIAKNEDGEIFFDKFEKHICNDSFWVRTISKKGSKWQLVESNITLLPFNSLVESDISRPWKVFSGLKNKVFTNTVFYDSEAPNLLTGVHKWDSDKIKVMIDSIDHSIFSNLCHLECFLDFLVSNEENCRNNFQTELKVILKEGFLKTSFAALRKMKSIIKNLIGFIDPKDRFALGTEDQNASSSILEEFFNEIWGIENSILIIPKEFDPDNDKSVGKPNQSDITNLLILIDKGVETGTGIKKYLNIAERLFDLLDNIDNQSLKLILKENENLKVIEVENRNSKEINAISYKELFDLNNKISLFYHNGSYGNIDKLQAILSDDAIYLIREKLLRIVTENVQVCKAYDDLDVLKSIGRRCKPLKNNDKLLLSFISNIDKKLNSDIHAIKGLRYLLHRDIRYFDNPDIELWINNGGSNGVWEKLWKEINSDRIIINSKIANCLPRSLDIDLKISVINQNSVVEELKKLEDLNKIDVDKFDYSEREMFLKEIKDVELWKKVPFHTTTTGKFTAVKRNVFLETAIEIPDDFIENFIFLKISESDHARQKELVAEFTEVHLLEAILETPIPSIYSQRIIELLLSIEENRRDLKQVRELLESQQWIQLENQKFISPEDIIDIDFLSSEIQRLAEKSGYSYASTSDINKSFFQPREPKIVKELFSKDNSDGFYRLGLLLENAKYFVGRIDYNNDIKKISESIEILKYLEHLPVWSIISKIKEKIKDDTTCEDRIKDLLKSTTKEIDEEAVITTLQKILEVKKSPKKLTDPYNLYLGLLRSKESLKRIKLLNTKGEWVKSDSLCINVDGIDKKNLLSEDQRSILHKFINQDKKAAEPSLVIENKDGHNGDLKEYFVDWKGNVRDELVGAFICLIDAQNDNIAQNYLGVHSVEWVLKESNWRIPEGFDSYANAGEWLSEKSQEEARKFLQFEFAFIEHSEKEISVKNLFDEEITVSLASMDSINSLIVKKPYYKSVNPNQSTVIVTLRKIPVGDAGNKKLSELLRKTAEYILIECYNQKKCNLEELWNKLSVSDQLEIEIVEQKLCENIYDRLRQIKAHQYSDKLKNVLDEYDDLFKNQCEFKNSQESFQYQLHQLKSRIVGAFKNASEVQNGVLDSLRKSIKDSQYENKSIPFELFQNADDALVELGIKDDCSALDSLRYFNVIETQDTISFIHNGRKINSKGSVNSFVEYNGFHRDLEKMVTMYSSDKDSQENITGKFGIGFKSVYLCCDKPQIISGDLKFEIIGGLLPQQLSTDAVKPLQNILDKNIVLKQYPPTVLSLKFREGSSSTTDILDRFLKMAAVQCIFGRAIRTININEKTFFWKPINVFKEYNLEIGRLATNEYVMVFRLKSGTILLTCNNDGAIAADKTIPSIWVTAPTNETDNIGFVVNGKFDIDPGRSRLADNKNNLEISKNIGIELFKVLNNLILDLKNDSNLWSKIKAHLSFLGKVKNSDFCASLWNLFIRSYQNDDQITLKIGNGIVTPFVEGCCRYFKEQKGSLIPNGLTGKYSLFIDFKFIGQFYEIKETWCDNEPLLDILFTRNEFRIENCVTKNISKALKKNLQSTIEELNINNLVKILCSTKTSEQYIKCDYKEAAFFGELMRRCKKDENEIEPEFKNRLSFKCQSGVWKKAIHILFENKENPEEKLRYDFAPDDSKLNENYNDFAKELFMLVRGQYYADAKTMAEWAKNANSEDKKNAVLKYLLEGELRRELVGKLKLFNIDSTWLSKIKHQHFFMTQFIQNDQKNILFQLFPEQFIEQSESNQNVINHVIGKNELDKIYDWWIKEKKEHIKKYYKEIYPNGKLEQLHDVSGNPNKRSWLVLLIIANFQRLGRIKHSQTRGFIDNLHSNTWLETMANSKPSEKLDEWFNIIKESWHTQTNDEVFSLWFDSFPRIMKIREHFDQYIQNCTDINFYEKLSISEILSPNENINLQGSGITAPSMKRTFKKGIHFIIRELLVNDVLDKKNKEIVKHAYKPTASIKNLLNSQSEEINSSEDIYSFLSSKMHDPTFDGYYDIPLQILCYDKNLCQKVIDRTIDITEGDEFYE